jgi:hypothetical protein
MARKHYLTQVGNEELARSAEVLSQVMTTARERLQVADAARREWRRRPRRRPRPPGEAKPRDWWPSRRDLQMW